MASPLPCLQGGCCQEVGSIQGWGDRQTPSLGRARLSGDAMYRARCQGLVPKQRHTLALYSSCKVVWAPEISLLTPTGTTQAHFGPRNLSTWTLNPVTFWYTCSVWQREDRLPTAPQEKLHLHQSPPLGWPLQRENENDLQKIISIFMLFHPPQGLLSLFQWKWGVSHAHRTPGMGHSAKPQWVHSKTPSVGIILGTWKGKRLLV